MKRLLVMVESAFSHGIPKIVTQRRMVTLDYHYHKKYSQETLALTQTNEFSSQYTVQSHEPGVHKPHSWRLQRLLRCHSADGCAYWSYITDQSCTAKIIILTDQTLENLYAKEYVSGNFNPEFRHNPACMMKQTKWKKCELILDRIGSYVDCNVPSKLFLSIEMLIQSRSAWSNATHTH